AERPDRLGPPVHRRPLRWPVRGARTLRQARLVLGVAGASGRATTAPPQPRQLASRLTGHGAAWVICPTTTWCAGHAPVTVNRSSAVPAALTAVPQGPPDRTVGRRRTAVTVAPPR